MVLVFWKQILLLRWYWCIGNRYCCYDGIGVLETDTVATMVMVYCNRYCCYDGIGVLETDTYCCYDGISVLETDTVATMVLVYWKQILLLRWYWCIGNRYRYCCYDGNGVL